VSKSRKSWREKFEAVQEPRIVDVPPKWAKRFGGGKMLIANTASC